MRSLQTLIMHGTVIEWYKFFGGLCNKPLKNDHILLGNAEGSMEKIDESHLGENRKIQSWDRKQIKQIKIYFENNLNS